MLKFKKKPDEVYEKCGKHFDSLASFRRFLEKNKDVKASENYSHEGSYSFTGTYSYEEMEEKLKKGDPEIMEGLKNSFQIEYSKLKEELMTKPQGYVADVHGLFFDVAKVIEGDPEAWYREPFDKNRKPRIQIPVLGAFPAKITKEEVIHNAGKILAIVKAMEDAGMEVEIVMFMWSENSYNAKNSQSLLTITVKDYDQPINWRMLSAILHPSFFRRMVFRYREIVGRYSLNDGYGRTLGLSYVKDYIDGNIVVLSDEYQIADYRKNIVNIIGGKHVGKK